MRRRGGGRGRRGQEGGGGGGAVIDGVDIHGGANSTTACISNTVDFPGRK